MLKALFLALGVLSACFGIRGFLVPSGFIDGGITGLSMLGSRVTAIPLSALLILINAPFLLIAIRPLGVRFVLISGCSIAALALAIEGLQLPEVTSDHLLAAVFGGVFLGAGIGLSIRGGGVLDGTEILALLFSKRFGTTVGDIVLVLNVAIFGCAAVFLGIEPALYSMLTYFSASKTVDFLIHGIEEFYGVMIVSSRSTEVKTALIGEAERGVTVYRGRGGRSDVEQDILFCVATRLEIPRIIRMVRAIDADAFFVTHHISEVGGGLIKRLPLPSGHS